MARSAEPAHFDSPAGWIPVPMNRIVRQFDPVQIILFGSQASGDARPDSDVDLLVVMPQVGDLRETTVAMLQALHDRLVPVDIVVTTPDDIARRGRLAGTTLCTALQEGRVLYERP